MGWKYANVEEAYQARLARRRERYHDPEVRASRIAIVKKSRDKRLLSNPDLNKQDYRKRLSANPRHNEYGKLLKYGLSLNEYDRMFKAQNGLCAICDQPETDYLNGKLKQLSVDHDKRFPKTHRMLLCSNCNRALGLFRESSIILENAIAYIEYWSIING